MGLSEGSNTLAALDTIRYPVASKTNSNSMNPASRELDVFQVENIQSQGDKDFQFNNRIDSSQFCGLQVPFFNTDIQDLEFLDFMAAETTDMDLKDINLSIEDSFDLSPFIESPCNMLSHEQSYDLNSLMELTDASFWGDSIGTNVNTKDAPSFEETTISKEDPLCRTEISMPEVSNETSMSLNEALSSEEQEPALDSELKELSPDVACRKYLNMRRKNNIASQRSRKLSKQKGFDMSEKLKKLEKENKDLLMLSEKLERERDILKDRLLKIMAAKK